MFKPNPRCVMATLFASLALALATVFAVGVAPAAASGGVQYLVPDEGMFCNNWADQQLSQVAGITWNYVGLAGQRPQNNMQCRFIVASSVGESPGDKWYGWNGVMPETRMAIDYRLACRMQYGNEVGVAWVNTSSVLVTADRADDWLAGGVTGWFCIGIPGRYYDQTSH